MALYVYQLKEAGGWGRGGVLLFMSDSKASFLSATEVYKKTTLLNGNAKTTCAERSLPFSLRSRPAFCALILMHTVD
jgi:hypothetical protein